MDPLTALLAARIVGQGYTRMQPQVHSSLQSEFRPVERAMSLLPEGTQDTMPDVKVDTREMPFGWYRQQQEARIDRNHPDAGITLVGSAESFKRAQQGNSDAVKKLASLLVHEKYHLDHDPGEGPAYDAQVDTLRRLKASPDLIESVLKSKVVGASR